MWPLGIFRTLRNCNACINRFKRSSELYSCRVIKCKTVDLSRDYVTRVCARFSNIQNQNQTQNQTERRWETACKTILAHRKNFEDREKRQMQPGEYELIDPKSEEEVVNVILVHQDGTEQKLRGKIGDSVAFLAVRYGVPIEVACQGQLGCKTCHVYVDEEYEEILEEASQVEEDMLDIAPFLRSNSRLCCQIILRKELEGLRVALPQATVNFYVDGYVRKH